MKRIMTVFLSTLLIVIAMSYPVMGAEFVTNLEQRGELDGQCLVVVSGTLNAATLVEIMLTAYQPLHIVSVIPHETRHLSPGEVEFYFVVAIPYDVMYNFAIKIDNELSWEARGVICRDSLGGEGGCFINSGG